jgi:hypothetical protein
MDENQDPTTINPTGSGLGSTGDSGYQSAGTSGTTGSGGADDSFGWTAEEPTSSEGRAAAERMLGQLQSMIDSVATQAAPVVRQIGAKAAELAAVAADRAGPLAHRAADATADASVRLAEKSRSLAADLRARAGEGNGDTATSDSVPLQGADDLAERSAKDDPAEGRPL